MSQFGIAGPDGPTPQRVTRENPMGIEGDGQGNHPGNYIEPGTALYDPEASCPRCGKRKTGSQLMGVERYCLSPRFCGACGFEFR